MYFYEGHLGGVYASEDLKAPEELYCEVCRCRDFLLGQAFSGRGLRRLLYDEGVDLEEHTIHQLIKDAFIVEIDAVVDGLELIDTAIPNYTRARRAGIPDEEAEEMVYMAIAQAITLLGGDE